MALDPFKLRAAGLPQEIIKLLIETQGVASRIVSMAAAVKQHLFFAESHAKTAAAARNETVGLKGQIEASAQAIAGDRAAIAQTASRVATLEAGTGQITGLRIVGNKLILDRKNAAPLEVTLPTSGGGTQVAPSFAVRPSLTGSTALGGTVAVDFGVAAGTPAPSLTGTLTRPGKAPAAVLDGATFQIEAADQGGTINLDVTAANSAGSVTDSTSLAVPAGATIGGIPVGAAGAAGTIYSGYVLAAGEEFDTLDLLTVNTPGGKYIPSHRRRGRRAINAGANDYYWTPEHTGYADANRGVAIGSGVADLLSVSGSALSLSTRLATAQEKALAWATTATTGPQRPQAASAIHSAGYQAVKWPCVIEARIRIPLGTALPAGGWPAFWTENVLPTWANTGEWDFEWVDTGDLYTNFITGTSSNDSIADDVVDTSDGQFHIFSMVATASTLRFYKDGVLLSTATKRPDAYVNGPMFWWLRHGVDLTPKIYGMNYSPAAWTSITATMDVDYVRLWTAPTATNLGYVGVIATENVAFNGAVSRTLPTKTELWGREDVTEYLIWQPIESAEPGISQLPVTGAANTWYGSATMQNGQWGPSFVTWNPTSRSLAASGFDQSGRMIGHLVAWDDTNGGTAGFARIVVNVGPRINLSALTYDVGNTVSLDVYAACDCGMLTTSAGGAKAKTISISGLSGSGLSYSDATGMLTGTAQEGTYTLTITCTNSIGQSASKTLTLTVAAAAGPTSYTQWTGPGWFDASDDATIIRSGGTITDLMNKRAGSGNMGAQNAGGMAVVQNAQNGRQALAITGSTSAPPNFVSGSGAAISAMFQGEDKPYTVIVAFKPTSTDTGFVWSASFANSTQTSSIALISRAANASVRRETTRGTMNDVDWGAGHPAGTPRIVAIKSTGTRVSVWDNSLTKIVDAAMQDAGAVSASANFRLFSSASGSVNTAANSKSLQFFEVVVEDSARSDADIEYAITTLATKWGITLS